MRLTNRLIIGILLLTSSLLITAASHPAPLRQADDPSPPDQVVKLIFIHHSTGENWLEDGYGDLGMMLGQNNYYVSDTNYGWGPDGNGSEASVRQCLWTRCTMKTGKTLGTPAPCPTLAEITRSSCSNPVIQIQPSGGIPMIHRGPSPTGPWLAQNTFTTSCWNTSTLSPTNSSSLSPPRPSATPPTPPTPAPSTSG